jgi:hypothetical protein
VSGITQANWALANVLRGLLKTGDVRVEKMMMGYRMHINREVWLDNTYGAFILYEFPHLLTEISDETNKEEVFSE